MYIKYYASYNTDAALKPQSKLISITLRHAVKQFGDKLEIVHNAEFDGVDKKADVAITWGVMGNSPQIVHAYRAAGKRVVVFDKALFRHLGVRGYVRVGIDGCSPLLYLMRVPRHFDRFERMRLTLKSRQDPPPRTTILYCGSSQKYCNFYELGDANDFAETVFNQIREVCWKCNILYRPKPSWDGFRDIENTKLSRGVSLDDELKRSSLLLTHGSAAAVEAIIAGVPVVTLGPCVAEPVANKGITADTIQNPYFPSDQARWQWLCNLAYCQWNADELTDGTAWNFIRNEIIETREKNEQMD